jgi:predicted Zn-dependent peptidase
MRHLTLLAALLPISTAAAQDVRYEKYALDNGLTVILHVDDALPQVVVDTWYRVGSKDEPRGRSGFAHLFEHLMFMGTARVPGSGFDDLMEAGGGRNNASTSTDCTNYFDIGPSELLPLLLWLEADRLEALGANMTQEKLDLQREVVRNERRQNYEIAPYGEAYLKSFELLYPEQHPYHRTVIGSHADLEAATVADVQRFFAEYYVPNNASLVVAGDFEPEGVKPLIAELFGTLPRGADVVHADAEPVRLVAPTVYTMTDDVEYAQTNLHWHSPPHLAPGDAELDLLGALLSDGVASRLYQRLVVERELALDVEAYQSSRLLGSIFTISATARPHIELATLEDAIDEVLAELSTRPVSESELARLQAQFEADSLLRLESLQNRADRLNLYEFHWGEPDSFARDLARYQDATPEALGAVARDVLVRDARVVLRVLPEPEPPPDNPRDARPAPAPPRPFTPVLPETFTLRSGITVHHWYRPQLPRVELSLLLPVGSSRDPATQAGVAALTAAMIDEGAGERGALEFADALGRLGARIETRVDPEATRLRLATLARNLDGALELLADAVQRPRFDGGEWERVRALHLASLARRSDDPNAVAALAGKRAFFGAQHPYGRPIEGTPATVNAIGLTDVIAFYSATWRPRGATLLVAGDVTRAALEASLARTFDGWRGIVADPDPFPPAEVTPPPLRDELPVVLVDSPGAVQTVVRFVLPAPSFADPTRPACELLGTILGGTFTSRLNRNLREDKGYTYGARASFQFGVGASWLVAASTVRADATGAALGEFLREFGALASGDVSEAEAVKARASRRLDSVRGQEGLAGLLDRAEELVLHGLPFGFASAELEALAGTTREELNALAAGLARPERGVLVLVGDAETVLPQLAPLDFARVERWRDAGPEAGD